MTAPGTRPDRGGFWYTTVVLSAAALSIVMIVDQALIVAAGRHLVARIDGWLATLQPAPARVTWTPPPATTTSTGAAGVNFPDGAATFEEYSDPDPETPTA